MFDRSGTLRLDAANVIGGSGELVKRGSGTVEIQADNTYTGATRIEAGTLQVGVGGAAGSLGAADDVVVSAGATLAFDRTGTLTVADTLSGAGQLRKRGSGTVVLTEQSPSFSGPIAVEAGRLMVEGRVGSGAVTVTNATLGGSGTVGGATTFASGGRHTPGSSTGVQTFEGPVTFNSGSTFVFELTGNTTDGRGSAYDGVDVGGALTFAASGVTSELVFDATGSTVDWDNGFWDESRRWRVFTADDGVDASFDVFSTITVSDDSKGKSLASARPGSFFRWQVVGNDVFLLYRAPVSGIELTVVDDGDTDLVAALAAGRLVEEIDWRVRGGVLTFFKEQPAVKPFAIGRAALEQHLGADLTVTLATFEGTEPLVLGAGATFTLVQSGTSTYGGVLSGAGALTKDGGGTLTLTGESTFTGGTRIQDGVLVAGASTSGAAGTLAGPFGRGGVTVVSGATLEVAGTTVGNALSVAGTGAAGRAGAVAATGDAAVLSGAVTLTGAATLASTGASGGLTVSGSVGGAHALTLVSEGPLTVTGGVAMAALLVRDTPTLDLTGGTFSVDTLAAQGVGGFTLTNTKALTIGTVGGVSGVSSSGPVEIATRTGDLAITHPVTTSHDAPDGVGLTLRAGKDSAFGLSTGGNVKVTGDGAITAAETRIRVFSATARDSTGLEEVADESRVNVAPPDLVKGEVAVAYRTGPPRFTSPDELVFGEAMRLVAVDDTDGAGGAITYALVSGPCTLDEDLLSADSVGECVVSASNRDFTTEQTVTLLKAEQTVTFTSPVGTTEFSVNARSTAPLTGTSTAGLPVTFTVTGQEPVTTGDTVCTLSGSVLTFVREGECTVGAVQAGDDFYEPAQAEVTLTVEPVVPGRASITSVSAGDLRIVVGLRAPTDDGGSPLTGYRLVATPKDSALPTVTFECPDASTPCVIVASDDVDLRNDALYTVTAEARNSEGLGPVTEASPEVRPFGRPNAVRDLTTRPDDETLTAEWLEPEPFPAAFERYEVSIKQSSETAWGTPVELSGRETLAYTFEGLTNGVAYDVQVVVVATGDGQSLESRTMIASGVPARLPGEPRDLTLTALSRTSVLASWSAPADDGGSDIFDYAVTVGDVEDTVCATGTDTFCVIDDLGAGDVVKVGAVNLVGTGELATVAFRAPLDDAQVTLVAGGVAAGVEGRDWIVAGGELLVFAPDSGKAVSIRAAALQAHLSAGSVKVTAASLAGSQALTVPFGRTLTLDLSAASTYGGVLSGGGTLVKEGAGALTLTGASTLSGAVTVAGGTLTVQGAGALGTGTVAVDAGATLTLDPEGTVPFANRLQVAGTVTKAGGGTTVLTGPVDGPGATSVDGGTLQVGTGGTVGTLPTGDVTIGTGATLEVRRSDAFTLGNVLTGTGTLRQAGTGTLTLTAESPFTGTVTTVAGALVVEGEVPGATVRIEPGVGDVASLAGSGKVGGTALAERAVHSPGSSTGLQTFPNDLTYETGSVFEFELTDNTSDGRGVAYDGVNVGRALTVQSGVASRLVFDGDGSDVVWSDGFWGESRRWLVFSGATSLDASDAVFASVDVSADSDGTELSAARPGAFFRWEKVGSDVFLLYRSPVTDADLTIVADGAGAADGGVLGVEGLDWRVEDGHLVVFMEGEGRALSIRRNALQAKLDAGALTITAASIAGDEGLVLTSTLTLGLAEASSYGGVLSGGGSLVKQGAGTLTLTGENTYTGTTTVSAGTLRVGDGGTSGTLGTGQVTLASDATLVFDRSDAVTVENAITGAGSVIKQGGGALTLTGANTYTGTTTVSAGTLRVGDGGESGTLGTGQVTVAEGATLVFDRSDAVTVANTIDGAGSVEKKDGGALTLTGTVTTAGVTAVEGGRFVVDGSVEDGDVDVRTGTTLGGSGTIVADTVVKSGATHLPGSDATGAGVGLQTFEGDLTYASGSTFVFTLNDNTNAEDDRGAVYSAVDVTGTFTLASGVTLELALGAGVDWDDEFWDLSRRWRVIGGPSTSSIHPDLLGAIDAPKDSRDRTLGEDGVRVGSEFRWIDDDGDLFLLYGAPAIDAELTIVDDATDVKGEPDWRVEQNQLLIFFEDDGRTIRIRRSDLQGHLDAGDLTVRVATLEGAEPLVLGTPAADEVPADGDGGSAAVAASPSTLTLVQTGTSTYAGAISGPGGLVKDGPGTLRLAGANGYAGTTTVTAGTLTVGSGATAGTLGEGAVTVEAGATLVFDRSDAVTVANAIGGDGSVITQGGGTLTLIGANTYAGTTTVNAGTLTVGAGAMAGKLGEGEVTVEAGATLTFDRSDAVSVANVIGGGGSVRHEGSGTLTLTGASTFTGGTTVTGGVLVAGASTTPGAGVLVSGPFGTGQVTVDDGATLDVGGETVGNALAIAGTGTTSTAGAVVAGDGASLTGQVTLTGAATVASTGALTLAGVDGEHPLVLDVSGSPLTLTGAVATGAPLTLRGTAAGSVTAGATATLDVTELLVDGVGTVALDAAGTVTVGTLAATGAGELRVRATGAFTVGTVGTVSGVSASGRVVLETTQGDLSVTQRITTSLADADEAGLVLRAGASSGIGSLVGGDVKISDDGTLTAAKTRIHVFSGSADATTLVPAATASQVGTTPPAVVAGQVAVAYRTGPPVFSSPASVEFRTTITLAADDATGGEAGTIVYAFVSGEDNCLFDATDPAAPTVRGIAIGDCVVSAENDQFTTEQTITVGPTTQTVTFTSPVPATTASVDVGTTTSLSAVASSGLTAITFSTTTDAVCAVSGAVVTFRAVGTCTLVATQEGDARYQQASATESVTVDPVAPGRASVTSVSSGDGGITVGFRPPSDDGGSLLTGYRVIVSGPGGPFTVDCSSTTSPCVVPGSALGAADALGKDFTVTIAARNSRGEGQASPDSPTVRVFDRPDAVRALTATPGDTTLTATWVEPANFGGGTFLAYEISLRRTDLADQPWDDTRRITTVDELTTTFTGLGNGVPYEVKVLVVAQAPDEAVGEEAGELESRTVVAQGVPMRPPSAPREVTFTPLARDRVLVSWRGPIDDGGAPVTGYTVSAAADDVTLGSCAFGVPTDTFCTLSGVGAANVQVDVAAVNLAGTGTSAVGFYRPPLVAPAVTVVASGGDTLGVDWFVLGGELLVMPGDATGRAGASDAVSVGRAQLQQFLDAADLTVQVSTFAGAEPLVVPFERTLTVRQSDASTYAGVLSGDGAVVKDGAGTLTLTGASTFTGGTTIDDGRVVVGASGALGTGTVTVDEDATLELAFGGTLTNAVTGAGALVRSGADVTVLAGAATLTGPITVHSGTLTLADGAGTPAAGGITVAAGATLVVDRSEDLVIGVPLTGGGALVKRGSGVLTLSGANTLSGALTVEAGALTLTGSNTFDSTVSVDGGTLTVAGAGTLGGGTDVVSVADGATLVFELDGAATLPRPITGGGTLVHRGTGELTLSGGSTLAATGTVRVEADSTLVLTGSLGDASVEVEADATLVLERDGTFANVVTGPGALVKQGAGELTLTGASTFTGGVTVAAGTVAAGASSTSVAGALTSGPFGTGTLTVTSGATLDLAGRTIANAVTATGTGTGGEGAVTNRAGTRGTLTGMLTLDGATTVRSPGAGGIALTGGATGAHVLTVGVAGDTAPVTLGGVVDVAGPLVVTGGTIDLTGTVDLAGDTDRLELVTGPSGTVTGSGTAVIDVAELLVRGGSQVLLVAPTMRVATFAAEGVGDLSAVFAGTVTIGTVDGVAGIGASGVVDVRTVTGDLSVAGPVVTSRVAPTAGIVLRAGTSSPVGTAAGGDVKLAAGGSVVAADAVVEVFSGTAAESTGIESIARASRVGTSTPAVAPGEVGVAYRSGPPVFLSPATVVFGGVLTVVVSDGTGVDPDLTLDEDESDEGVCELNFVTLSATGVGTCVLVAENASFTTEQTVEVTRALQTIVFTSTVPSQVSTATTYRPVAVSSVTIEPDLPEEDVEEPDTGGLVATPGDGQVTLTWDAVAEVRGAATTGYVIRQLGEPVCEFPPPPEVDEDGMPLPTVVDEDFVLPTTCTVEGLTNGEEYVFTLQVEAGLEQELFAPVAVTLPDPDAPVFEEEPLLPVTFAVVEGGDVVDGVGPVCVLEDGLVRFLASGTCTIEATQPGDGRYLPAEPVRQTLVVGLINRTVVFPVVFPRVVGDPPFLAGASVTAGGGLTYTAPGSAGVCTVDATSGLVSVLGPGLCTLSASAAGDGRFAPASPVVRSFLVEPTRPGRMTIGSVSPGDGSVTVGFTLPGEDGGAPVGTVQLRALADDGTGLVIVECLPVSPCTVEGLTNGTTYTLTAVAINAAGAGPASAPAPGVVPAGAPDAVRALRMTPGDGVLDVAWEPPTSFGGGTFVRYEVSVRPWGPPEPDPDADPDGADGAGGVVADVPLAWGEPVVITDVATRTARLEGLTNGVRYDVKVVAISLVSGVETGETAGNTAVVSGVPLQVPGAPRDLTLTRVGPDSVLATWAAPQADGGAPVTGYRVTPSCVLATPTATSCVITRLPRGLEFTVAVRAINLVGESDPALALKRLPAPPAPPAPAPAPAPEAEPEVDGSTDRPGPTRPRLPGDTIPGPTGPTVPVPPTPDTPVVVPGRPFVPGDAPRVIVGGLPVPIDVTPTPDGGTRLKVGGSTFDFGPPPGGDGLTPGATPPGGGGPRISDLTPTPLRGDGLLPDSTLKVWVTGLPTPPGWSAGPDAREIGTIAVSGDGSFDGTLTVGGRIDEPPIPIGRHVIQVVGFDADGDQIVIEQTIDVAQHAPRPELDRTTGRAPETSTGTLVATVAGLPATVTVDVDGDGRTLGVGGDGWTIALAVDERAGRIERDVQAGTVRITLSRTGVFTATGSGMQPGSRADVWMFSDATLLGVVTVADDGTFALDVAVDPRFIGTGEHTLQVQGIGTDGYVRATNVAVTIDEPTGLDALPGGRTVITVLVFLALAGSAFLLIARRRRDDDEEDGPPAPPH